MTAGLGCDGESVAMTSATSPSLEDLLSGVIPDSPRVVLHNPMLAFENGAEFLQAWYDAEEDRLDPFLLVVEGAIGDERRSGEGHWTGFGVDAFDGQPITVNDWIDRLAPKAAAVVAVGTCATYGGVPAMKNNPTGAMGLPRLPRLVVDVAPRRADRLHPRLPRAARQHDLDPARAHPLHGGHGPAPLLDERLRPVRLFGRTTREGCSRAGFTEQGRVRDDVRQRPALPRQARLQGSGGGLQRPAARLGQRPRRLPQRRRDLHRLHDARLPDKFMPFMEPDPWGNAAANFQRFTYGPLFRHFRKRNLLLKFEQEPVWRGPGAAPPTTADASRGERRPR